MSVSPLAPILFFAYNRPVHTRKALESLMVNDWAPESDLFIFCDGPKKNASEQDLEKIADVRKIIRENKWCNHVTIVESEANRTLPVILVEKVSEFVRRFGKVIVLEDDLILSKGFLKYMNEGLELYKNEPRVMDISGYIYPVKGKLPHTFFLPMAMAWGWATWERAWNLFNPSPEELLVLTKKKGIRSFNVDDTFDQFSILKECAEGTWKYWDIRWQASIFVNDGLSLAPVVSLVKNIGHDSSGMHCKNNKLYLKQPVAEFIPVKPIPIAPSPEAIQAVKNFFLLQARTPFHQKVKGKISYKIKTASNLIRKKIVLSKPMFWNNFRTLDPVSRKFGFDRGKPIDRFYIEDFLKKHSTEIRGQVIEVGELIYTRQFGHDVKQADVITAEPNSSGSVKITDLTKTATLPDSIYDCFICTQTLNVIYNFNDAIKGAHLLLKKEGVVLATVAGVCQISRYDAERWGDYWRFTPMSIQKAFAEIFGEENVTVDYYGNCLAAISLLKGLASHELSAEELNHKDQDYPVIITVVARKI